MLETLIPADLSDVCNAELAAAHIEGLVNVAFREEVFNYGNTMTPPPVGGIPKVSIAIGPAVPTADGLKVGITAAATFIYYPSQSHEEAPWPSMTSIPETADTVPSTTQGPMEAKE